MNLSVQNITIEKATTIIRDDAFELWCDAAKQTTKNVTQAAYSAGCSLRGIQATWDYLRIEFNNIDTGETLEMNVRAGLHHCMIKYKIYPSFITDALKQFYELTGIYYYSFGIGTVRADRYNSNIYPELIKQ